MTLYLIRNLQRTNCTTGNLIIPNQNPFYTLEPKIPIPAGTFRLTKYQSPKFGISVPLLNETPGHSYVEIHMGNTARDTRDCILVGNSRSANTLIDSREALARLVTWFLPEVEKQEIFITIINQIPITTA